MVVYFNNTTRTISQRSVTLQCGVIPGHQLLGPFHLLPTVLSDLGAIVSVIVVCAHPERAFVNNERLHVHEMFEIVALVLLDNVLSCISGRTKGEGPGTGAGKINTLVL